MRLGGVIFGARCPRCRQGNLTLETNVDSFGGYDIVCLQCGFRQVYSAGEQLLLPTAQAAELGTVLLTAE